MGRLAFIEFISEASAVLARYFNKKMSGASTWQSRKYVQIASLRSQ
jgi:hypothetical protein